MSKEPMIADRIGSEPQEVPQVQSEMIEPPHEIFSAQAEIVESIRADFDAVSKAMDSWVEEVMANPSETDLESLKRQAHYASSATGVFDFIFGSHASGGPPTSPLPLRNDLDSVKIREDIRRYANIIDEGLQQGESEAVSESQQETAATVVPEHVPMTAEDISGDIRRFMERMHTGLTDVDGILDEQQTSIASINSLLRTNADRVEASARKTRWVVALSATAIVITNAILAFVTAF